MRISLDTETTGLDVAHGARPFLVTTCDDSGKAGSIVYWEWPVDPLTRQVQIPEGDLAEIRLRIAEAELVYLQNAKFDVRMLKAVGINLPWSKVRDTLAAGHLLGSNHDHHLDAMVTEYLGVDMGKAERVVEEVTKECRAIVKRDHPQWRVAAEGAPGMPSVSEGSKRDEDRPWKNDMWLPRALARHLGEARDPRWLTACKNYANCDSEHTLSLGLEMEAIIRDRKLWNIYLHRIEVEAAYCEMEERGVTAIGEYTERTISEYRLHVAEAECALKEIAATYGHDLQLAEGASINDNMRDFFYGAHHQTCPACGHSKRVKHWLGERVEVRPCPKCAGRKRRPKTIVMTNSGRQNLGLPVISIKHGGGKKEVAASLDKEAMATYLTTLDGPPLEFIQLLMDKRKHDTDLTYMEAYRRFWVPIPGVPGYYRIHPFLNPFGTDHLRASSSGPNMQNVGKQEDICEECEGEGCVHCNYSGKTRISVRNCFGPAPGRVVYTADYQNIELRIPAYESGEEAMIEVFEAGDKPPYWGSYHNLIASIVHPDEYYANDLHLKKDGFKKLFKSTLYQWIKNFNFAKQYGCGREKGDRTARKRGAFDLVDRGLPKLARLQAHYLDLAERTGYVETLPDRRVDPTRGYPILAARTEDNRVLSTTPFNYHVSGTACWCKATGLVRCAKRLAEWRREGFDAWVCLEIHDELMFDFPVERYAGEHAPRIKCLKALMELSGEDLIPSIPTPVNVERHDRTWAEGIAV